MTDRDTREEIAQVRKRGATLNDYERAMTRRRYRCEKCGNEGPADNIPTWCRCGSEVRYEAGHSVRTFLGRFWDANEEPE